jgi:hypothetical protein
LRNFERKSGQCQIRALEAARGLDWIASVLIKAWPAFITAADIETDKNKTRRHVGAKNQF